MVTGTLYAFNSLVVVGGLKYFNMPKIGTFLKQKMEGLVTNKENSAVIHSDLDETLTVNCLQREQKKSEVLRFALEATS